MIGRWTTIDPKRIDWSPYVGMFNNPVNGTDPAGGGPGDDMEFEYAQAQQQMEMNLYDEIRMSDSKLLDEIAVTPSATDYLSDAWWAYSQFSGAEVYANAQLKFSFTDTENQKATIPVIGYGVGLSENGFKATVIDYQSMYYSYKASDLVEYRIYPLDGKTVGEDASFRVLILMGQRSFGPVKAKAQAEWSVKKHGAPKVGMRVVGEYTIKRTPLSVEITAGFRQRMIWPMWTLIPGGRH